MNTYWNETQQLEVLKKWWQKYGTLVIATILAATIIIILSYWWQGKKQRLIAQSSVIYESMLFSYNNEDQNGATAAAQSLIQGYDSTIYAQAAKLLLAKFAIQKQDYKKAQEYLHEVLNSKHKSPLLKALVQLRYAKVLALQKHYNEALALVKEAPLPAYEGLYAELRGDFYQSMGNVKQAQRAYSEALGHMANANTQPLLLMKYDELNATQKL